MRALPRGFLSPGALFAACATFATFATFAIFATSDVHAEVLVRDEAGAEVRLKAPARRVVSLAPYLTENLFAIGAGERIVGTVEFANHPEAAKRLPRVGAYENLDAEAVVALKPDLVVAWRSGNPPAVLARLRALGIPVWTDEPGRIEEVAATLERLGALTGLDAQGGAAALAYRQRLDDLRARHAGRPPVRTFYQVWDRPLMTVGGRQIISDVIRICGGANVFAAQAALAPTVSVEAVIAADPEAIVASGMGEERPDWLDAWKRWKRMTAVARDNLFFIPPDLLQRHTPRLLDGAERMCAHLETTRGRRPAAR